MRKRRETRNNIGENGKIHNYEKIGKNRNSIGENMNEIGV